MMATRMTMLMLMERERCSEKNESFGVTCKTVQHEIVWYVNKPLHTLTACTHTHAITCDAQCSVHI